MKTRRKTRQVMYRNIGIGSKFPITIQSMTNAKTYDIDSTVKQIKELETAGCEIVRVAVPEIRDAESILEIKKRISVPLVADIHFDYRLAVESIKNGVDALRLNPGNIGEKWKIKEVVSCAKDNRVPIRIGVNAGSLEKKFQNKDIPVYEAMVKSALEHSEILENQNFSDIVISLKASNIEDTVESYRMISSIADYPLHIGITEAGGGEYAVVKSSIGLGILLHEGIGDTLRVSLTGDPVKEVFTAKNILKSLGIRKEGVEIISCPTCGRCSIDVENVRNEIEKRTQDIKTPIIAAVMGCIVNGPGEAKEADVGIAGGKGFGMLFKSGKQIRRVSEEDFISVLENEIRKIAQNKLIKENKE